jgi:penicillin-binding protein 1A
MVVDAPIMVNTPQGLWTPKNSHDKFFGPAPLRTGIEQSRNLMTIRIAKEVGMDTIAGYAERFGVYDQMQPLLANSLGAQESTLFKMVAAYAMFANGGERVEPTLVDRVQDRYGATIYRHDARTCVDCGMDNLPQGAGLTITTNRERVMNAITAYQLTSMMEGVVQRGTATVIKEVGKRIAGKTGTTNDAKDVWFVGFSPDMAVGVYMGYDRPRSLGNTATAGLYAAPIFRDFMMSALKDKPDTPFRVPPGIKLISVDAKTGMRSSGAGTILEAFKPGTAPPESLSLADPAMRDVPDADRGVGTGTGGLY